MQDPSAASGGNAGLHPFHTPTAACVNSGSPGPPASLVFPTTALQGVCIGTLLGSCLDVPGGPDHRFRGQALPTLWGKFPPKHLVTFADTTHCYGVETSLTSVY